MPLRINITKPENKWPITEPLDVLTSDVRTSWDVALPLRPGHQRLPAAVPSSRVHPAELDEFLILVLEGLGWEHRREQGVDAVGHGIIMKSMANRCPGRRLQSFSVQDRSKAVSVHWASLLPDRNFHGARLLLSHHESWRWAWLTCTRLNKLRLVGS